jgi:undecaprenyl-diphosphatase
MTLFQAIILGIVQGLTEFIPISSTAHLIFASRLIGLYNGANAALKAEQTTATIAVIQLGTLLAVLIYFARDIINITVAFTRDHVALLKGRNRVDGSVRLSQDAWL